MDALADPSLVVFAWGHASRGDDGIGPEIARRLEALKLPGLRVIEDFQLQVEHVMDLVSDVPALFVDASVAIDEGFRLERIKPGLDPSLSTHAVSPAALLGLYEKTLRKSAPAAWLLHVAASDFELGGAIGAQTRHNLDAAWAFLEEILGGPARSLGARLAAAA